MIQCLYFDFSLRMLGSVSIKGLNVQCDHRFAGEPMIAVHICLPMLAMKRTRGFIQPDHPSNGSEGFNPIRESPLLN